jgi:hypothetical protein
MGVRRPFPGGAGRGQDHTFCLKNNKNKLFFSKKSKKHTIFGRSWPARGARAPFATLRTPMRLTLFVCLFVCLQTVIRVDAELMQDTFSTHLNLSYTLEENEKNSIATRDVSFTCYYIFLSYKNK